MIDLHNHILPDVDDGARSVADSLGMARALLDQDVTAVCVTPHTTEWSRLGGRSDLLERVTDLQSAFAETGLGLEILPGAEVHIEPHLPDPITLNDTPYVLLELPYDALPPSYDRVIFDLQVRGLRPIIAHPERITPIADDPNILFELVRRGCLAQLTAASLAGVFGSRIKDLSQLLLDHHLAHLIASDAHDTGERLTALPHARHVCGYDRWLELTTTVPSRIVAGEPVQPAQPVEVRRRRFLGVF